MAEQDETYLTATDIKRLTSQVSRLLLRPSSTRYRLLIRKLQESDQRFRNGASSLEEAMTSLRAVLLFISEDLNLALDGPVGPLSKLHASLHDAQQGAKPEMFKQQRKETGRGDKPTNLYRDEGRARLAAVLDLLIQRGRMPRVSAATWLAKECKRLELRDEAGGWVNAKHLQKWRDQINDGSASTLAKETYDSATRKYAAKARSNSRLDQIAPLQHHAATVISTVKKLNPNLPPSKREQR